MKKFLLLLVVGLLLTGCGGLQCYYGDCKDIGDVAQSTAIVAADADATDAELVTESQAVADYYADLLDNSRPLCGLYASPTYHELLVEGAAYSAEIASRAEKVTLTTDELTEALVGFAIHLDKLQSATVGEK